MEVVITEISTYTIENALVNYELYNAGKAIKDININVAKIKFNHVTNTSTHIIVTNTYTSSDAFTCYQCMSENDKNIYRLSLNSLINENKYEDLKSNNKYISFIYKDISYEMLVNDMRKMLDLVELIKTKK